MINQSIEKINKSVELINSSYKILKTQSDYSPNNKIVNHELTKLINFSLSTNENNHKVCNKILENPLVKPFIPKIREISYRAECEMEQYWAKYFNSKLDLSFSHLKEFWYYKQYENIVAQENKLINKCNLQNDDIAFIGSGPLPLTAIILSHVRQNPLNLIDIDLEAIYSSNNLCKKTGKNLKLINADAMDIDYKKYDLVFVASMVKHKKKLIDKLYNDNVKYIIIRDAEKLSQLFYDKLKKDLFEYYEIKDYIPGNKLTVNSSYLLQIKES